MKTIYATLFCAFWILQPAHSQVMENFEYGIPSTWSTYETETDDPGFVPNAYVYYSGNQSIYHVGAGIATESTSYLVTQAYSIVDQATDILSFWYRQDYTTNYYNYSGIWISTGSGNPITHPADFIEIQELNADYGFSEDAWTNFVLDLSAYEGQTVYIAFKYTGDLNHSLYIDYFSLSNNCTAPVNLNASNITPTTANLHWTESGSATEWQIEYGPLGFSQGTGSILNDNDATAGETLPGLSQNTNYAFYVSALCSTGPGSFANGPFEFKTQCTQIFTAPWSDDVEGHALVENIDESNCWEATSTEAGGGWYWWNVGTAPISPGFTGPSTVHSGSKVFFVEDASFVDAEAALFTNAVNFMDASVLNAAFGIEENYNPLADLNCDGNITIIDGSILNTSLG